MTGIYAALRSGFLKNKVKIKNLDPVSMISYAFLNTLSISALDEKSIDQFIILTNAKPSEGNLIKENLVYNLGVENDKIKIVCQQDQSSGELVHVLKTLTRDLRTIMIGSMSVTSLPDDAYDNESFETMLDYIRIQFENGKEYIDSDIYQNEIFPLEISAGKEQQGLLFDELNKTPDEKVNFVNGVASILLKTDNQHLTYHRLPLVKLEHWSFKMDNINQLIHLINKLDINESWIVEFDYLSIKDFISFQKELKSNNIDLPQMKSGGSLFFGNSNVLNGFRAITSAMAQLEKSSLGKAIIFILTDNNSIEVFTLYREKGEEKNV